MTFTRTQLVRGGLLGLAFLALILLAAERRSRRHSASRQVEVRGPIAVAHDDHITTPAPHMTINPPLTVASIAPLPANATSVPDSYLLQLSTLVDLDNARDQRPNKNRWMQAIPAAGKLLEGPCDCEQRNWLTHFVEMGNFALSNSDNEYHELAALMTGLGRNNNQAIALREKSN